MKKIITIVLSIVFMAGCSSTKEGMYNDKKSNADTNIENNLESLKIDSNWNIPIKGELSGTFCGFIDNNSFELLGEDGTYYAINVSRLIDEDFSYLEIEKTKITIEYVIENEGSQLTLVNILDKK